MKLPKKAVQVLHFRHGEKWYKITQDGDKYNLYKCEDENDYSFLGTGNSPVKLENKVYDGKLG